MKAATNLANGLSIFLPQVAQPPIQLSHLIGGKSEPASALKRYDPTSKQKELKLIDFADCFSVSNPKDYIKSHIRSYSQMATNNHQHQPIRAAKIENPNLVAIQSPSLKETKKLQHLTSKVERLILSNPYKLSNYTEENHALVPERLINRNVKNPKPIFEDKSWEQMMLEKEGGLMAIPETVEQNKTGVGRNDKRKAVVSNYNGEGNSKKIQQTKYKAVSLNYADHARLLQESEKIFTQCGGESSSINNSYDLSPNYRTVKIKTPMLTNTSQSKNNNEDSSVKPKLIVPKGQIKKGVSIYSTNAVKVEDGVVSVSPVLKLPSLSHQISPSSGYLGQQMNQTSVFLPYEIKKYLEQKKKLEISKTQKTLTRSPTKDGLNHSALLLRQAKEIINSVDKNSLNSNMGIQKLSQGLKSLLTQQSPSTLTLQKGMLEDFDQYRKKSLLRRYQVEDLYLAREADLPLDVLKDIERRQERIDKKHKNHSVQITASKKQLGPSKEKLRNNISFKEQSNLKPFQIRNSSMSNTLDTVAVTQTEGLNFDKRQNHHQTQWLNDHSTSALDLNEEQQLNSEQHKPTDDKTRSDVYDLRNSIVQLSQENYISKGFELKKKKENHAIKDQIIKKEVLMKQNLESFVTEKKRMEENLKLLNSVTKIQDLKLPLVGMRIRNEKSLGIKNDEVACKQGSLGNNSSKTLVLDFQITKWETVQKGMDSKKDLDSNANKHSPLVSLKMFPSFRNPAQFIQPQ